MGHKNISSSQNPSTIKPVTINLQTRPFAPLEVSNMESSSQEQAEETSKKQGFSENLLEKLINTPTPESATPVQRKPENRLKALQKLAIQTKLNIGEPNDKYEKEADETAAKVVQQINTPLPNQPIQRQESMEEEDELQMKSLLQRSEGVGGGVASTDLESSIQRARGSGQSLDGSLSEKLGHAMGADFSGVKIHTDSQSDQLNKSIQAKAFTTGQDVFFRQGAYDPSSRGGQELIAHELTHVVQQNGGTPSLQRTIEIISSNSDMTPNDVLLRYQEQSEAQMKWDRQKRDSDQDIQFPSKRKGWKPTQPPQGPRPADPVTPLVAIGDVYTGVTQTGQDTWPGLVRQLSKAGGNEKSSLFTVFTGTHGQIGGQYLDDQGRMDIMYKDASHTVQDKVRRDELIQEMPGCNIKVLDVFEEGLTKPEDLRNAVKREVAKERVVILAWCFSVEAFKAVPEEIPKIGRGQGPDGEDVHSDEEYEYVGNRQNVKIKDIVADSFGSDLSGYSRKQHPELKDIDTVTHSLVEQLINLNKKEVLGTLFISDRFPLGKWEQAAWSTFQDWLVSS